MRAKPSRASRAALTLPTPKMKLTGFGARKPSRFACAQHGKAARLVEIGSDLGQEFVAGESDRDGDRELLLDLGGKARQHLGRREAVQALGAGEIEERLVDRQRLDQWRQRQHHLPHLAADARIFLHVRPHHAGLRAEPQRLEHRHRRAHAVGAGDIAGGGDDAAPAAADDHRLGGKRRIVALFDGGVEGVAVDMGDRKLCEFVVAHDARRAADRRSASLARTASARQSRQKALTARLGPILPLPSALRARAISAGSIPALSANATRRLLVAQHMLEHAGEKAGLAARRRGFASGFNARSFRGNAPAVPALRQ